MKRELLALVGLGVLTAAPLLAQQPATAADQKPDEPAKQEETIRRAEEVTVESASKAETNLIDAPATMSVVTSQTLETSPAQTYADLLRSVPGMNVIQTSARDINLTTRQATSTLQQLAARARGRPVGLPGFLRARAVGLRAHRDLRRHQADRGGAGARPPSSGAPTR